MTPHDQMREALRQNVRAFRHAKTGEIRYLLGGDVPQTWEDVIIIPNLSNEVLGAVLSSPTEREPMDIFKMETTTEPAKPVARVFKASLYIERSKKQMFDTIVELEGANLKHDEELYRRPAPNIEVCDFAQTNERAPLVRLTFENLSIIYERFRQEKEFHPQLFEDISNAIMDAMERVNSKTHPTG